MTKQVLNYKTKGQIEITRLTEVIPYPNSIEPLIDALDSQLGVLLASSFEYPGRYTRWDIGFINPPLQITTHKNTFTLQALNERGINLLTFIAPEIKKLANISILQNDAEILSGEIQTSKDHFPEELRSKQPSTFTVLRAIIELFFSQEDSFLGLYGAFGYDLTFQFETIHLRLPRSDDQRDLVLFLPDEIYLIDHRRETAHIQRYDFNFNHKNTEGLARTGKKTTYQPATQINKTSDHEKGEYAKTVHTAKEYFKRGDLFEVVPGQTFFATSKNPPSEIFRRLRTRNPSPYGFLINLGQQEYLIGASPEMYVRVKENRVETCPISGTIARGQDAIEDAKQILTLLNSKKETSELTMCTDVDRNDKSRICEPGSVRVIGRRLIEMYSRLIHTVDHVEGILREGYDALDAFLTHTWAVTVTGAPKLWAMQFIEDHEKSARHWYGGAIGALYFNGDINTGLTLRTIRLKNGIAEVRAGATLLYDSIPEDEEKETQLKASALLDAICNDHPQEQISQKLRTNIGKGKKILLVDHQDSFVHTLANYLRQTGAEVITLRSGFSRDEIKKINPDLIVLSPGPGCPDDFKVKETIKMTLDEKIPLFGVCLGLQGIVEYFGGKLDILDYPMHGKPVCVKPMQGKLLKDLTPQFTVGLYHSLYADPKTFPSDLVVSAQSDQEIIMAIEHKTLPIWAVQFHPESIMSLEDDIGFKIVERVMELVK